MKNPESNRRQQRGLRGRRHSINRAIVRSDKRKGCSFCPREGLPPEELQYDHLIPRKSDRECVANMMRGNTDRLIAEINKCRLICIHCHRERHRWEKQIAAAKGGSHA